MPISHPMIVQTLPLQPPISILMYHQVGRFNNPRLHRPVYCDVGRFRRQMAWLKWCGCHVMSLTDAYACLFEGKPIPARSVVITFDDGCENFREYAWPVLKQYGFPVTMFLVAGMLGKVTAWMDDVPEKAPLMDEAAIRALQKEGVHFGAHSMTHVRLALCDPKAARGEIFDSKARLEDLLGEAVPDFCYPYGSYNAQVAEMVAEAGYRSGLTCIRGAANYARNPFELPRKAISYGDTLPGFLWKLYRKDVPKDYVADLKKGASC